MSARLLDTLCAQHKDTVVVLDGGQSVGNGQGRAAMGQLFEALAHKDLALVVEGAGGFVQNEDGRVLQEDPRDRNALLLTARELDAPLTHIGIKTVLQGADKALCARQTGRFDNFLPGRAGLTVGDVIRHRTAEQVDVLLDDADVLPQALEGDVLDVLPVDEDAASRHLVEAGDEVAERRLAAAGRADQRQTLTGLDVKADMVEHLVVVVGVLEADVLEADGTRAGLQGLCVLGILDGHGVSMISAKRSMPVMPRWNCSANSTMRRMVAMRVVT